MDASTRELLDYNHRGVISACTAAEQHLSENGGSGLSIGDWCTVKHLKHIGVDHHLVEAQIHSANDPELSNQYRKFKEELEKISKKATVEKVRGFRNRFRKFIGDKSLDDCGSICEHDNFGIKSSPNPSNPSNKAKDLNNSKDLNKSENNLKVINGGTTMNLKDIGRLAVGQFIGNGAKEMIEYVDVYMGKTGEQAFARPSTWISILGGIGIAAFAAKKLKGNNQLMAAIAGTNMTAREVTEAVKEYSAGIGTAGFPAFAPVRTVTTTAPAFVPAEELIETH